MTAKTNKFPSGQFGTILVDPPWAYEMYSEKGHAKSPYAHYDCMTLNELKSLRDYLDFATTPNAVLFMWGVFPMIPQALELIDHWGFKYKTGGAWHKKTKHGKDAFGTGYIFRSACEPYFIATRGNPTIKNRSTRNIIEASVREHSRKPDCVYDIIENLFDGAYLELFARTQRKNWTSWGNQTDKFEDKNGV